MRYNWDSSFTQNRISKRDEDLDMASSDQESTEKIHIGIAQVTLHTHDFDKLKSFYIQALSVQPRDTRSSEYPGVRACRFELPGIDLFLSEIPNDSIRTYHQTELVFRVGSVNNVEKAYEHLKTIPGCVSVQFPRYTHDNRYETIVKDPEGNLLIFRD